MTSYFAFPFFLSLFFFMHIAPIEAQSSAFSSIEELSQQHALISLEHLIAVTQRNLQLQQKLLQQTKQYFKAKEYFFAHDQEQENTEMLVSLADEIWQQIQESQLQAIFPEEFIEEIILFAHLAHKSQIASP